jgi:hypothetical protein
MREHYDKQSDVVLWLTPRPGGSRRPKRSAPALTAKHQNGLFCALHTCAKLTLVDLDVVGSSPIKRP